MNKFHQNIISHLSLILKENIFIFQPKKGCAKEKETYIFRIKYLTRERISK